MNKTVETAKDLLGSILTSTVNGLVVSGRIVETEAYLSKDDPACHAARGKTKRNEDMFLPEWHSYVYLIYGMHHCFNVVTEGEGIGAAVLIRAVEPLLGGSVMMERRKKEKNLTNGPGRVCQAFGITTEHSGLRLYKGVLTIKPDKPVKQIVTTTRIGITQGAELPLRFYEKGNPFISRE